MVTIYFLSAILSFGFISADTCTNPSVTTSTYTSTSIAISTETAYVAEFNLKCVEENTNLDLFAEIEPGVLSPVSRVPEKDGYQISWAKDHKTAPTGTINIRVFNNDGYAAYRKAQRNGEDVTKLPALFDVVVRHPKTAEREEVLKEEEEMAKKANPQYASVAKNRTANVLTSSNASISQSTDTSPG